MAFLNPDEMLDQLNLRSDMIVAEFGCGSGGFSISLAKKLDDGLVYAIDILSEPLSALKSRAKLENLKNIRIIRSDLEKPRGSTITEESLDLVVIPNMLFQVENKSAIITEAKRILKSGGAIVVIDWKSNASKGPEQGRVSEEEIKNIAENEKLIFVKEIGAGNYHFALVFVK